MEQLTYADFPLRVERDGAAYVARVQSHVGEASASFTLPFTPDKVDDFVVRLGTPRGTTRGASPGDIQIAEEFGGRLFDAIFTGDVLTLFRSGLIEMRRTTNAGLRLSLRLQDVPELANLPWEFLFDTAQHAFLSQDNHTPVVRYSEMPQPVRSLAVQLPLRILVMISSPEGDTRYPSLKAGEERSKLDRALADLRRDGLVTVDYLEKATLPELQRKLRESSYHIFHYIGHGEFDTERDEGALILEDDAGGSQRTDALRLGVALAGNDSLRLAVLNACEGARSGLLDAFAGVAMTLVRRGIPAVAAMQFSISDTAAVNFAGEFYAALAAGYPIDAATAEGRKAIYFHQNDLEWATPVLYMRAPDGQLFHFEAGAGPATPQASQEPRTTPAEAIDSPVIDKVVPPEPVAVDPTPKREILPQRRARVVPDQTKKPGPKKSPSLVPGWTMAAGGMLMLGASFLDWHQILDGHTSIMFTNRPPQDQDVTHTINAWHDNWSILVVLAAVSMTVLFVIGRISIGASGLVWTRGRFLYQSGASLLLFLLFFLIVKESIIGTEGKELSGHGFLGALLATLVVAVGVHYLNREDVSIRALINDVMLVTGLAVLAGVICYVTSLLGLW